MANQSTIPVLVNSFEAQAIMDAWHGDKGRREFKYALKDGMEFLIDAAIQELDEWRDLVDHFEDNFQKFEVNVTLFEIMSIQEAYYKRLGKFDQMTAYLSCKKWSDLRDAIDAKRQKHDWVGITSKSAA